MKLSRYIAVSILSHLLLIGLLWLIIPTVEVTPPVFNVNIVGPIDEKPVKPKMLPPVKKQPSPAQKPPEKLLPETLYGKDDQEFKKNTPLPLPKAPTFGLDRGEQAPTLKEGVPGDNGTLPKGKGEPSLVPPSYLFDRETIEKFARKEPPVDKELTLDVPGFNHRVYLKEFLRKVDRLWLLPIEVQKKIVKFRISGEVVVNFSIGRDGKLSEIELRRTSGYPELDEAAMNALKNTQSFWPLPVDWEQDDLKIELHFIYGYGSTLVM